jgi:type II secretory pathway pseudopilin PulG
MLIEVLITLAIVTLISAAVAFGIFVYYPEAQRKASVNNARATRQGAKTVLMRDGPATCPTFDDLVRDGMLDEDSPAHDSWGNPWRITCDESRIVVETDGPDRVRGTPDDIRVPAPASSGPN